MTCEHCTDPDGSPCFPVYGVGPHTHKPGSWMTGEMLPPDSHPAYREDPESPGHGVYWCPVCGDGKPEDAP